MLDFFCVILKVISDIVPWASSRAFFFHRLRRRLLQNSYVKRIHKIIVKKVTGTGGREGVVEQEWKRANNILQSWMTKDLSQYAKSVLSDDKLFVDWIEKHGDMLEGELTAFEQSERKKDLLDLASTNPAGYANTCANLFVLTFPPTFYFSRIVDALKSIISGLSEQDQATLLRSMK